MVNTMEENQMQITLPPEVAGGVYSNLAIIAHSPSEFVIDFVQIMPQMKSSTVRSRIILTPENSKKLLLALQENIHKYEQQFGKITLHSNVPSNTTPMSFGGGEA